MAQTATLSAAIRQDTGKGAARSLRRQGKVPGVIYGHGRTAEPLAGDRRRNGSIRGRSVAHAQGRILVLGQCGHRRHPR